MCSELFNVNTKHKSRKTVIYSSPSHSKRREKARYQTKRDSHDHIMLIFYLLTFIHADCSQLDLDSEVSIIFPQTKDRATQRG